jgi:hypothetical protein
VAGGDGFVQAHARQSEIQNFYAGFPGHNVAGLEIAVNNGFAVGFCQRRRDLRSVEQDGLDGERSVFEPRRERFALHQFHHQVVGTHIVKGADIGVIERRNRARLPLKPGAELLASGFDGDGAA